MNQILPTHLPIYPLKNTIFGLYVFFTDPGTILPSRMNRWWLKFHHPFKKICWRKCNKYSPNGGLMVIYNGRIRKTSPETDPSCDTQLVVEPSI